MSLLFLFLNYSTCYFISIFFLVSYINPCFLSVKGWIKFYIIVKLIFFFFPCKLLFPKCMLLKFLFVIKPVGDKIPSFILLYKTSEFIYFIYFSLFLNLLILGLFYFLNPIKFFYYDLFIFIYWTICKLLFLLFPSFYKLKFNPIFLYVISSLVLGI